MKKSSPRIFYGWWVVAAAFLVSLYVHGVVQFGFSPLIEPLSDEFGWSYTLISLAGSVRGLEVGLLAPLMGVLVDRWSPGRLMLAGTILVGLSFLLMSRISSLFTYYAVFALISLGMSALSPTVTLTAVANWFDRKIGTASGIMHSGVGFAGLAVPVVVMLIATLGWRTAVAVLGAGILFIAAPLTLLIRHKPEQYGLLPDGEVKKVVVDSQDAPPIRVVDDDIGYREAVHGSTFWHIALATMLQIMMVSAVITHIFPYLSSIGMSRSISSFVAGSIPLASVIGRMGFGWIGDKADKKRIMIGGYAMMGVGFLFFASAAGGNLALLAPFVLLFSVGYGGNAILRAALVREYYGRRNFGTIHGFIMGIVVFGSMTGPPLAGFVFDNWGSYQGIWFAFAALSLVPLTLIATMSKPQRPSKQSV
ncbi:MFS transporter [Chloroflexota bacterium]